MNTIKMRAAAMALSMTILLTACGGDVDGPKESSAPIASKVTVDERIPKNYHASIQDQLKINASVLAPEKLPKSVGEYPARKQATDKEAYAKQVIFQKMTFTKDRQVGGTNKDREGHRIQDIQYIAEKNQEYFVDLSQDESGKDLSIAGANSLWNKLQNAYPMTTDTTFPDIELPFLSKEKAEQNARAFFEKMGVHLSSLRQVSGISHTELQKRIDKIREASDDVEVVPGAKESKELHLSEADDCYQFRFFTEIDGTPVTNAIQMGRHDAARTAVNGTTLDCWYTKDGIAYFKIDSLYQPSGKAVRKGKPLSFEQAIDLLKQHFSEIIQPEAVTVTQISYAFVPKLVAANQENYILTPAWIFKMQAQSGTVSQLAFDALTGKEMK